MQALSSVRGCVTTVLGFALTGLFWGLLTPFTASAQPAQPAPTQAAPAQPDRPASPVPPAARDEWERALARTPLPKMGCFTASYPSVEWQEVPCVSPPSHPFGPATRDSRSQNVGGGLNNDWTADSKTNKILNAVGSFDSVTGATSITGTGGTADTFSLQVNTNLFDTGRCINHSAPAPAQPCKGWQQFIFSNAHATDAGQPGVLMQYFLLNYVGICPSGWQRDGNHCTVFSQVQVVTKQTAANLAQLHLWGLTFQGPPPMDQVSLTNCSPITATCTASAHGYDSILGLASGWRAAEFNIFGESNLSPIATFSVPSTLVVRVALDEGANIKPKCHRESFTAEMNNLNLAAPSFLNLQGPWPALIFTETNDPNALIWPACAFSAGEPHLLTFDGELYDFQASGDFVLVEADPDFVVQTRQERGNWPVTANRAVATKIGGTRVAVCLGPARLEINGALVDLADGRSLSLPSGVSVLRNANVYLIKGQDGETVRAQITSDDLINVGVDLGYAPRNWVRGLLGNANGRTGDDTATRDGRAVAQPVSFADLYGPYADSWRVPPDQSLLCRDDNIIRDVPDRPFYASDLDPADYKLGQATCKAAGVKEELLDACILDVGVLGQGAAEFFVRAPAPIAVMPRP
jgi:hypothetical protein